MGALAMRLGVQGLVATGERNMPMITIDRLETSRLVLRRPQEGDIVPMTALADRREIATRLALMPHPFYECHAAAFIESP